MIPAPQTCRRLLEIAISALICYEGQDTMEIIDTPCTSESEERRLKYERRQYSYADHIPERRSGEDRRNESEDTGLTSDA